MGKTQPKRVSKNIASQYSFLTEGALLTEEYIAQLLPAQQEIADQLNRRTEFRVLSPDNLTPLKPDYPK
jgi:peptidoglycan-associated lipoprotein